MLSEGQRFDFAVVGGGVYGLSAAYFLSKTEAKVALFQRFAIGHSNGSSHGPSRITRSAYEYDLFRDLNNLALDKYWPEMEEILDSKLVYPNEFIYYDQNSQTYQQYKEVAGKLNEQLVFVSSEEVEKKYENFPKIKSLHKGILDTKAGMIASRDYIERLSEYLRKRPNIVIFQNCEVKNIYNNEKNVSIQTESENIYSDKVLLTCGRWISQLIPEMSKLTTVVKQVVGYFQLENMHLYQFGRFPSACHREKEHVFYTVPDKHNEGVKIGTHVTPSNQGSLDTKQRVKLLQDKAQEWFGKKLKKLNKVEECYYTVTKTQQFIIDWADPNIERVLICSCCSGHGFKFAPLMGSILSDLLIENKSMELFEKNRHRFQFPYHQGVNLK